MPRHIHRLDARPTFSYSGQHYSVTPTDFHPPPPPAQQPHPPVWVVGPLVIGRDTQPSLDRAARWDGLLPQVIDEEHRTKADSLDRLRAILVEVSTRRAGLGLSGTNYDVVIEADSAGEFVQLNPPDPPAWEGAGATWWVESWWSIEPGAQGLAEVRRRMEAGPRG